MVSIAFSSWLYVLFGMLLLDTVLCALFLKSFSESLLELTIAALIFIVAKLLERNPIQELDTNMVFTCVAAGTVVITLCVMFYHLFFRIIPASPYRRNNRKKHHKDDYHQPKTPARTDRDQ